MTNYIFNIACYDKSTQVPKIIRAVFNSVPYKLDLFKTPEGFNPGEVHEGYDLLIINRLNCNISNIDVKKHQLTNPEIPVIIIDKDYNAVENWLEIRDIKFLIAEEIVQKLPVFLGEVYSRSNDKILSGYNYFNLMKESLRLINRIIILADKRGDILFLNQKSEKFLGIEHQEYIGLPITDYISDGAKIWNFIYERCVQDNKQLYGYRITFRDAYNAEKQETISARLLDPDQKYILIESDTVDDLRKSDGFPDQYLLLDKFADSIANDLLNPVNIISGRIQMLRDSLKDDEKYRKSFEALENQVTRIQDVTSKMLSFARLKQDSVPQKIDINKVFSKVLFSPSIKANLKKGNISFTSRLADSVPVLEGLISHFDLLIRTILELSFTCLGNKGTILVETEHLNNYLNHNWVGFRVKIDYYESIFTKKENLHTFLSNDHSQARSVTIESTIIDHIIRHYQGNYQLNREGETIESVRLLFPVPESKH